MVIIERKDANLVKEVDNTDLIEYILLFVGYVRINDLLLHEQVINILILIDELDYFLKEKNETPGIWFGLYSVELFL